MEYYPQELAQVAVCQSHTGHMTGLWFLPTRPLRLNTNERMNEQNMKLVTTKFKSGGLHKKHVVATWNLGNHLGLCL